MNDRFRFRAWNKEEKKMYYDAQDTYDYMTGNPVIFAESFGCLLINDEEWEVEQCTGLKDKNGNLIYEGDIIKDEFCRRFTIVWSEEDCMFEGRVIYRDPEYSDRFDLYKGATDDCEIIGNIHEQAEQKE